MKVTVLGSGSRGNAFAVTANGVSLLVDAGFGPKVLMERATTAGVDLQALAGILLTHEHGDHARGAAALARRLSCPVFASRGTLAALADRLGAIERRAMLAHREIRIGPFHVEGCRTSHDAAEPMAFVVRVARAKLGVAYDLGRPTAAVRYLLREVTTLLLEANHDELLLRLGPYPPVVRDRIAGAGGHLSNRAAAQLVTELCHGDMRSIVLVHLSDQCNRADLARAEVERALVGRRFAGQLLVAVQDQPMEPLEVGPEPGQLELGLAG